MPTATRAAANPGSRMPILGTGRASCSQTAPCQVCSRKPSDSENCRDFGRSNRRAQGNRSASAYNPFVG
jgi:hypothetical protein